MGVFFIDKAKASKVFTKLAQTNPKLARVGLIYAKDTQSNGTLHSIADADSPVKGQAGIVKRTPAHIFNDANASGSRNNHRTL